MDFSVFFTPSEFRGHSFVHPGPGRLIDKVAFFNGDLEELSGMQLAIFGVCEDRNSAGNPGASNAPDAVRNYFYKLYPFDLEAKIIVIPALLLIKNQKREGIKLFWRASAKYRAPPG